MMGSEIRIATKKVDKQTEVTAYSVIDIFDRKVESKVIRFFSSGMEDNDLQYTWIAIPSKISLPVKNRSVPRKITHFRLIFE